MLSDKKIDKLELKRMTFEELEKNLPNGFHDAKFNKMTLDFLHGQITISVNLLYGSPDGSDPEQRRSGELRAGSPCLLVVEPPDPKYPFQMTGGAVGVDGDKVKAGQNPTVDELLQELPSATSVYRFFIEDWNSFLYIASSDVQFSWDTIG